jgi:hypothetical protein
MKKLVATSYHMYVVLVGQVGGAAMKTAHLVKPSHLGANVTKGNKMTTRMPKSNCPVCNTILDAATAVDGTPDVIPSVGDISLCASCTSVLEFDDNLALAVIDIKTLPQDTQDEIVHAVLASASCKPTLH